MGCIEQGTVRHEGISATGCNNALQGINGATQHTKLSNRVHQTENARHKKMQWGKTRHNSAM